MSFNSVRRSLGTSAAECVEEIEKKFRPNLNLAPTLAQHCKPVIKIFTDRYYDTTRFDLGVRDMWLRQRQATFELKYPMGVESSGVVDFYHEATTWASIAIALSERANVRLSRPLPTEQESSQTLFDIDTWLARQGLSLFGELKTCRHRYALSLPVSATHAASATPHQVHVDLDTVDFVQIVSDNPTPRDRHVTAAHVTKTAPASSYIIGEVELVAAGGGLSPTDALRDVFGQLGISPAPVRGKVLQYLHEYRPRHYAALEASGLIGAKLGLAPAEGA